MRGCVFVWACVCACVKERAREQEGKKATDMMVWEKAAPG